MELRFRHLELEFPFSSQSNKGTHFLDTTEWGGYISHGRLLWSIKNKPCQTRWNSWALWFWSPWLYRVCINQPFISVFKLYLIFLRSACSIAIPEDDTVILTGGWWTRNTVAVYDVNGWKKNLPSLLLGRGYGHGCTSFVTGNNRVEILFHWLCKTFILLSFLASFSIRRKYRVISHIFYWAL